MYFITLLAYRRKQLFGTLVNGEVILSECGKIAREEWFNTAIRQPYVALYDDEMVVMPDHIHGIIWIIGDLPDQSKGAASLRPYKESGLANHALIPGLIGAIVRAYKSSVTYRINMMMNSPGAQVWHRITCNHIIRDESELCKVWDYFAANPQQGDKRTIWA